MKNYLLQEQMKQNVLCSNRKIGIKSFFPTVVLYFTKDGYYGV